MIGKEFEEELETQFRAAGLDFDREPSIGGLRPDFLIRGPRGKTVVIEAKRWGPKGGNTARALNQVKQYREATGADHAFLVLPELKKNFRQDGVVSAKEIVSSLEQVFQDSDASSHLIPVTLSKTDKTIFAAMPFTREYDDTYFVAMSYAAKQLDASCKRVDRTEFSGDIVEEIKRLISESFAVIVDLSESKPNVLYEAGFAHALGKPSVHISATDLSELPFDVRNWSTISYNKGQTTALRNPLVSRLREVIRVNEN